MSAVKVTCRQVISQEDREAHDWIRNQIFVVEQGLFDDSDQDALDADPNVIHVVAFADDEPAGTVRLYRVDTPHPGEELWKGDRLAVLPAFRHIGIGGPLVRHAVTTAGEAGGNRMVAWIQPANVVFFTRLGWHADGPPSDYLGSPHQHMWIELA
ncbi:MSMEG_0567/Sll0786 family nitrogen starvation N-acetyltransferase [Nocardioides daejeonensis]|uniref:MSMEG_0567/Sll0786 family nitrogen starvation N-acetyltransferase n=1 Tax=Nocardioides daejeonensis TaxID=1046556 RepID=UPI000D749EC7|nr:MSMEG_0567/Sll0786 family nitrogen starvation N-acetyltransferase [Nocardioides daejeonensis]